MDLLDFIEDKLLRMLPAHRETAAGTAKMLENFVEKCNKDQNYYCQQTRTPRRSASGFSAIVAADEQGGMPISKPRRRSTQVIDETTNERRNIEENQATNIAPSFEMKVSDLIGLSSSMPQLKVADKLGQDQTLQLEQSELPDKRAQDDQSSCRKQNWLPAQYILPTLTRGESAASTALRSSHESSLTNLVLSTGESMHSTPPSSLDSQAPSESYFLDSVVLANQTVDSSVEYEGMANAKKSNGEEVNLSSIGSLPSTQILNPGKPAAVQSQFASKTINPENPILPPAAVEYSEPSQLPPTSSLDPSMSVPPVALPFGLPPPEKALPEAKRQPSIHNYGQMLDINQMGGRPASDNETLIASHDEPHSKSSSYRKRFFTGLRRRWAFLTRS
jgi:hypothetical protein